jgi:putative glutamine amidotransferase
MPRPLILISGSTEKRGQELADFSLSLSLNYPLAVEAGGGMPWMLPCMPAPDFIADSVRRADGVLMSGGDDIDPRLYRRKGLPSELKETVHPAAPERDLFELMLIDEVLRQRKPLLAICRGQQILNVALGGTLVVDIARQVPGALNHRRLQQKHQIVHEIKLQVGSLLAEIARTDRLGVNSTHHQAVANIAKPLRATAVSIDGIIEGLEADPRAGQFLPFLLAVQFHPERLFARHAEHLEIFRRFIDACRVNAAKNV